MVFPRAAHLTKPAKSSDVDANLAVMRAQISSLLVSIGPEFKAVVFDLDGVLIDTEQTKYQVWRHVFEDFGARFTRRQWQTLIGTTREESPISWLRDRATSPLPDPDDLQALLLAEEMSAIENLGAMPGVREWIDEADELGLALAVASSSSRNWVEARLEQIGLSTRFAAVICPTSELRSKPSPDLYLAAAQALTVEPSHAVAIEDSMNGIAAARDAGFACIAVPNALTIDMDLSRAHHRLRSLAGSSLAATLTVLAQSIDEEE